MLGKRYQITAGKKKELEKELAELETKGRDEIADKLDLLRSQPESEEDNSFSEVLGDKSFLEKRIIELKEILKSSRIVKKGVKRKEVQVGATVKVGIEGSEVEYMIVATIEADPLASKVSEESPVGKALLGAKVGDTVVAEIGAVKKKFRILKIK